MTHRERAPVVAGTRGAGAPEAGVASRSARAIRDGEGFALALVGAVVLAAALVVFHGSRGSGYDFAAYDAAARRLATGQPLYQAVTQQGPFAPGPAGIYLYPPPLAVLLLALVPLLPATAAAAWQALHVLALAAACAILPVPRSVRLASFGIACLALPTLLDLNLGNVSLFVLLAGAAGWRWTSPGTRDPRPAWPPALRSWRGSAPVGGALVAGALAALAIAVRPQVAILLPWWVWRRTRAATAAVASAVVAGAVLVVGSAVVAGPGAWEAYARLLANLRGAGAASSDVGLAALALRAGLADPIPTALFAAGALLALAAVVVASRRDAESGFVAAALATVLVVPLLWPHYLVLLVLPGALLAAHGRPWGLALPLLAWLPGPVLPLVALAGCWAPVLAAPPPGERRTPTA